MNGGLDEFIKLNDKFSEFIFPANLKLNIDWYKIHKTITLLDKKMIVLLPSVKKYPENLSLLLLNENLYVYEVCKLGNFPVVKKRAQLCEKTRPNSIVVPEKYYVECNNI